MEIHLSLDGRSVRIPLLVSSNRMQGRRAARIDSHLFSFVSHDTTRAHLSDDTELRHVQKDRMRSCGRRHALLSPAGLVWISAVRPKESRAMPMVVDVPEASVSEYLRRRDEAADFKCKGGMMDCDGNRREYAKEQYNNFLQKSQGKLRGTLNHLPVKESCNEDIRTTSTDECNVQSSQGLSQN